MIFQKHDIGYIQFLFPFLTCESKKNFSILCKKKKNDFPLNELL